MTSARLLRQQALELAASGRSSAAPQFDPIQLLAADDPNAANETLTMTVPQRPPGSIKPPAPSNSTSANVDGQVATTAGGVKVSAQLTRFQLSVYRSEVKRLRTQLAEKTQSVTQEHEQAVSLRRALQKALDYALHASEWQEKESAQLQLVVQELQAELGTLMAHLLMAEEARRQGREQLAARDADLARGQEQLQSSTQQVEALKQRLHRSFRDYVDASATIDRLEMEVKSGSREWRDRCDLFRRQLQHLTVDYERAVADADEARRVAADHRVEMDALVGQFGQSVAECEQLRAANAALQSQVQQLTDQRNSTATELSVMTAQKLALDADLLRHQNTSAAQIQHAESQLATSQSAVVKLTDEKAKSDQQMSVLTATVTQLQSNLAAAVADATSWQTQHRQLTASTQAELTQSRALVHDMKEHLAVERQTASDATARSERLLLHSNELQNEVDRLQKWEQDVKVEEARVKKQWMAKLSILEDHVAKAETVRLAVVAEKKAAVETTMAVRTALKQREEDIEMMRQDAVAAATDSAAALSAMSDRLMQANAELDSKRKLIAAHEAELSQLRQQLTLHETAAGSLAERETELRHLIMQQSGRIHQLETDLTSANEQIARKDQQYRESTAHIAQLNQIGSEIGQQRDKQAQQIKQLHTELVEHEDIICQLRREGAQLISVRSTLLQQLHAWLEKYDTLRTECHNERATRKLVEKKYAALEQSASVSGGGMALVLSGMSPTQLEEMKVRLAVALQGVDVNLAITERRQQLRDFDAHLRREYVRLGALTKTIGGVIK